MITNQLRQLDPSRTLTLRRSFSREHKRRWQSVAAVTRATITAGIFQPGGRFHAPTVEGKVKGLTAWLDGVIADSVMGDRIWQRPYLTQAYLRGIKNAHADLRRNGRQIDDDPAALIRRFTHAPTLNAFYGQADRDLQRVRRETVETAGIRLNGRLMGFVGNKNGEEEKGIIWPNDFHQQITSRNKPPQLVRLLEEFRGAKAWEGEIAVAQEEEPQTDEEWLLALLLLLLLRGGQSALSRSNAIASNLIVGAAAEAVLNRLAELGITAVTPEIENVFTTAGDSKVCFRCQELASRDNGRGSGVYSVADARGLIPVHSGCRCSWRQSVGVRVR